MTRVLAMVEPLPSTVYLADSRSSPAERPRSGRAGSPRERSAGTRLTLSRPAARAGPTWSAAWRESPDAHHLNVAAESAGSVYGTDWPAQRILKGVLAWPAFKTTTTFDPSGFLNDTS